MSRQYAQPLICDTRRLIRSRSFLSRPLWFRYLVSPSIACNAPGLTDVISILGSMIHSFLPKWIFCIMLQRPPDLVSSSQLLTRTFRDAKLSYLLFFLPFASFLRMS